MSVSVARGDDASPVTTNAIFYTTMESLDNKQKLGIGDRISFRVVEDQEDPKSLLVADSGELEIPYLGRITAVDKTPKELAWEIKAILEKDLYFQATVIIAVDLLNKNRGKVYLVGNIRTPGPQEIPSDEVYTLSKAILKAGGFTDFADKNRVKLTRLKGGRESDSTVTIVDVSQVWEKGRTERDVKLEPGDLIFVPSRAVNF